MHSSSLTEEQLAVTAALSTGDAGRLYRIVAKLFDEGVGLESVLFDVLLPAESDLGGRWQDADYLVPEEHLASTTIETVLSLLVGSIDQPASGTHAVLAAAEGDDHSIAGRAAAAFLLFLGFRTSYLGANVPASELQPFLEGERPDVLILSATLPGQLVGARAGVKAAHDAGVPVVAGGRVFGASGQRASQIGADAWVHSPRELPGAIESLAPDIDAAEARACEPTEELIDLMRRRSSILADAESRLGGSQPEPVRTGLGLLLGAVEGAVFLSDDALVEEHLRWQTDAFTAQGHGDPDAIRSALAGCLGPWRRAAALLG